MTVMRFLQPPNVVWRVVFDRLLLRRVDRAEGFEDNADVVGVAALVWVALDDPADAGVIAARISEHAAATAPSEDDIVAACEQLVDHGWLRSETTTAPATGRHA